MAGAAFTSTLRQGQVPGVVDTRHCGVRRRVHLDDVNGVGQTGVDETVMGRGQTARTFGMAGSGVVAVGGCVGSNDQHTVDRTRVWGCETLEPESGFEPLTCSLRVSCSTD